MFALYLKLKGAHFELAEFLYQARNRESNFFLSFFMVSCNCKLVENAAVELLYLIDLLMAKLSLSSV